MIRNYYNNIDWEKYIPISNDIYSSFIKNDEDIENILLKTLSTSINDDSKISQKLRFPHDLDLHQPLIWGDKDNGEKIIEVLETLGGENVFNLNGESEGYIYGISRKRKEILTFYKNSLNIKNSLIMDIKEFFIL
jgi:hypothetical protein